MREATLWLQDCRLTSRRRREMFAQEYSLSLYNNMGVGEGALAAVQTAVSPLTGRGRAWMLLLTELFRWWAVVSFCLIWWLHLLVHALPQCSKRWWNNVFKVTVLVKILPRWAARCGQNIDVASGRRASIRHDDFWLPHVRTVTPTVVSRFLIPAHVLQPFTARQPGLRWPPHCSDGHRFHPWPLHLACQSGKLKPEALTMTCLWCRIGAVGEAQSRLMQSCDVTSPNAWR